MFGAYYMYAVKPVVLHVNSLSVLRHPFSAVMYFAIIADRDIITKASLQWETGVFRLQQTRIQPREDGEK